MPVEIRELVIRAEVSDTSQQEVTTAASGLSPAEKERLIQLCAERVLNTIKRSQQK